MVMAPPQLRSMPQSNGVRELPYISTGGITATVPNQPGKKPSFGGRPVSVDTPTASPGLSDFATQPRAAGQVAEPRALQSTVFSGADIEYYFEK